MATNKRTPDDPVLEFDETTKDYGSLRALGPLDLAVPPGETVALVGKNGSGKSTMLATAASVIDPTGGQVLIRGEPAGDQAARAVVSYIPDQPILYTDLSLSEHLEYLSRLHGSTPEAHDAATLLERLGLSDRVDDLPKNYSRGLRQKAAIVIALCRPFGLLLVDEPFAGLDLKGQDAFVELLDEARHDGASIVVATHDRERLEGFDRIVTLEDGQIIDDTQSTV